MKQKMTVKWFDTNKGFGFLEAVGSDDVFVHYSNIITDSGYASLNENDIVECEIQQGEKGLSAIDVRKI